jgi:hypothetical protein
MYDIINYFLKFAINEKSYFKAMPKKIRLSVKQTEKAILGTGAIMTTIADILCVDERTAKKFIESSPRLRKLLENERIRIKDKAKSVLYNAVINEEKWAVLFLLSREPEFSLKTDITSNNETINQGTVIIMPDNNRDANKKSGS